MNVWDRNFFGDDFALRLGNELLESPLLRAAHRPPRFSAAVEGAEQKPAEEKGGWADDVDHLGHREPTCCPHLLHGGCVYWVEVNQQSKDGDSDEDVGKSEKVEKEKFRSRDFDLLCESGTFDFIS